MASEKSVSDFADIVRITDDHTQDRRCRNFLCFLSLYTDLPQAMLHTTHIYGTQYNSFLPLLLYPWSLGLCVNRLQWQLRPCRPRATSINSEYIYLSKRPFTRGSGFPGLKRLTSAGAQKNAFIMNIAVTSSGLVRRVFLSAISKSCLHPRLL